MKKKQQPDPRKQVNTYQSASQLEMDFSCPAYSEDGCLQNLPAAGNRNGDSMNNIANNGNYWSSTENDQDNANYLNFNSNEANVNNNNRNNGQAVRLCSELATKTSDIRAELPRGNSAFSKEQLLVDLYRAYKDARKHKRGKCYQLAFEMNLETELIALRDELYNRTYEPLPSTCFIIHDPKMREVFAANFRDRIVHHLFYNYTHELFERSFIYDSYSCIKHRGTHFGIRRLEHHIRACSRNYTRPCYVLKIDICGYFMHIHRPLLLHLCERTLEKMHCPNYDFVHYLLKKIALLNPIENCRILGDFAEWKALPDSKSLFCSAPDCGLPIGNLTSQLFSNIYLNEFDQYCKRALGCKHYGRYVDDAYIVSADKRGLLALRAEIAAYLQGRLGLQLNKNKVQVLTTRYGVEFLGAFLKPHYNLIAHHSLRRMRRKINHTRRLSPQQVASFSGVLSHYRAYGLQRILMDNRKTTIA